VSVINTKEEIEEHPKKRDKYGKQQICEAFGCASGIVYNAQTNKD
jgi:hypothetical protein